MYRVKTNLNVNGEGWGLKFKNGVAYTERDDLARRLKSLGYEVEAVAAPKYAPNHSDAELVSMPEQVQAENEAPKEKVVFCGICGRPFGSQAALTRHTNKMHS